MTDHLNDPANWPEWVNFTAKDEDGELWGYELEPTSRGDCWSSKGRQEKLSNCPNWRETLRQKPVDPYAELKTAAKDPYTELKTAAKDPTKQIRCIHLASSPIEWIDCPTSGFAFCHPVECYEVRDKPQDKPIDWSKLSEYVKQYWDPHCHPLDSILPSLLIPWQGGECPIPNGLMTELTQRNGKTAYVNNSRNAGWYHDEGLSEEEYDDIIAFRITGIALGWKA